MRNMAGLVLMVSSCLAGGIPAAAAQDFGRDGGTVTVRTENYPRPPYSGATYYIYEQNEAIICTKLEVCNKFGDCTTSYKSGFYKDDPDIETGNAYGSTPPVVITPSKYAKHVCLMKYSRGRW